ncbi:MAG: mucoidy inhibitor MuiA family protein [Bacteroidota bacterium]
MVKFFAFIGLLMSTPVWSADTLSVSGNIKHVTVFLHGAEVQRTVEFTAPPGKTFLKFTDLPYELNPSSIQAKSASDYDILLVRHSTQDNQAVRRSADMKVIEAEEKKIVKQIELNQQKIEVYNFEEQMLYQNREINPEKGVTAAELRLSADFFRSRILEIREAIIRLKNENEILADKVPELNRQMSIASLKINKASSIILVAIESKAGGRHTLDLSYFISSAGWTPTYDFRYKNLNSPLTLVYQANVFQSSGENWDNVMLTLSNSKPTVRASNPVLEKWYIDRRPPQSSLNNAGGTGTGSVRGRLLDAGNGEPMPFANVVVKRNGVVVNGAQTDFDGAYTIKPLESGYYDLEYSFPGYRTSVVSGLIVKNEQITFADGKLNASELQTVEVVAYKVPLMDKDGGRSGETIRMPGRDGSGIASTVGGISIRGSRPESDKLVYIDGVNTRGSSNPMLTSINMNELTAIPLTVDYRVKIPYTINSDGNDNTIRIKSVEVAADYIHHAVPRLDPATFLTAELTGWQRLNLLNGVANLYSDGTFIGQSALNVENTNDTLVLSLGRDPEVVVERKAVKELYERKTFGSNIRETFAWEISVRNNKGQPITLLLQDQVPLAVSKTVEIEVLESSQAKLDSEEGIALWKEKIESGGKKTFKLKYSVKYPENTRIYR